MINKKIYLFGIILLFGIICSLTLISSLETAQISYIQRVQYTPYCINDCVNDTFTNATTNLTSNRITCTEKCYANFNISIRFPGDDDWRTSYLINTSNPLYKDTYTFDNTGVYITTLGNSSDVSGINEKIINLTSTINSNLIACYNNNSAIINNATTARLTCKTNIDNLNNLVISNNEEKDELDKQSSQRIYWAVGGILFGIFLIKVGEPYFKGILPKKDPNEQGNSSMEGQY